MMRTHFFCPRKAVLKDKGNITLFESASSLYDALSNSDSNLVSLCLSPPYSPASLPLPFSLPHSPPCLSIYLMHFHPSISLLHCPACPRLPLRLSLFWCLSVCLSFFLSFFLSLSFLFIHFFFSFFVLCLFVSLSTSCRMLGRLACRSLGQ